MSCVAFVFAFKMLNGVYCALSDAYVNFGRHTLSAYLLLKY